LNTVEKIGIESIDEMDFAATESEEFDVVIALNVRGEWNRGKAAACLPYLSSSNSNCAGEGRRSRAVVGTRGAENGPFPSWVSARREWQPGRRGARVLRQEQGVTTMESAEGVWATTWPLLERKESPVASKLGIHEGFYV